MCDEWIAEAEQQTPQSLDYTGWVAFHNTLLATRFVVPGNYLADLRAVSLEVKLSLSRLDEDVLADDEDEVTEDSDDDDDDDDGEDDLSTSCSSVSSIAPTPVYSARETPLSPSSHPPL